MLHLDLTCLFRYFKGAQPNYVSAKSAEKLHVNTVSIAISQRNPKKSEFPETECLFEQYHGNWAILEKMDAPSI